MSQSLGQALPLNERTLNLFRIRPRCRFLNLDDASAVRLYAGNSFSELPAALRNTEK